LKKGATITFAFAGEGIRELNVLQKRLMPASQYSPLGRWSLLACRIGSTQISKWLDCKTVLPHESDGKRKLFVEFVEI
jgi:hypothetical protein